MPGVTSIVDTHAVNDRSIQVFYNTNQLNLAFSLKSGKSSGSDSNQRFGNQEEDPQGNVVNPSELASSEVFGVKFVVGFTKSPQINNKDDDKHVDLSIISPVRRFIKRITITNQSIAMSSTGTEAYVYYTDGESQKIIKENNLEERNVTLDGLSEVVSKSSLAAYCDPATKKRHLIYQSPKNLFEYEAVERQNTPIHNSTDARLNTSLAVYYDSTKKKVFLYFVEKNGGLRKIVKSNGNWGTTSEVLDTDQVDNASQIAVTHSDGVNHLFYVADGEHSVSHYRDQTEA